jgi:ketosteroid isomerase-like protein
MQNGIEKISDFFQIFQKTAFEKDVLGMINLYQDNVVVFDMWNQGFVLGLEEWSSTITDWLRSLKNEKVKVLFEMIDIHEGEHVGFANAIVQFQAIAPDESVQRSMKNRISLGFVKKDGFWKVNHQHTSAPVDSALKAILNI